MKSAYIRRRYRRPAAKESVASKKDNQSEQQFFGETMHEPFFKPAEAIQQSVQRQCADCEKEDKVQRSPEKKEEEKVMKKEEEKKEEKVQRVTDKKEEEKVQKKEEKKEEEKVKKKEDKKEEEKIHKKEGTTSTTNTATTASNYIGSINSKGQSMDAGVQSFYENRIGADFSNVKIHTGKEAAESAKDMNAQAYAYGNHIVFNEGKYQPETSEGKHLLAHELAHVVQQNSRESKVSRKCTWSVSYTADLLRKMAATVFAETYSGQENDVASIYFNLVEKAGGETGLTKSSAYNKKSTNFKIAMCELGDPSYDSDVPTDKWYPAKTTIKDYVTKDAFYLKKVKNRVTGTNTIITDLSKDCNKNLNPGWTGQGNLPDFNNESNNDMHWTKARAYFNLQEAGAVSTNFVKVLKGCENTQFVFDNVSIDAYFTANPKKLPKAAAVSKYDYFVMQPSCPKPVKKKKVTPGKKKKKSAPKKKKKP